MPRKKILGPATTGQVLDYFTERSLAEAEIVLEIVTAAMSKRRPLGAAAIKPVNKRKPRTPPAAPAQYGETLGDA